MLLHTITESNILMKAFDKGSDVQVLMTGVDIQTPEQWFSRHTYKGETFPQAAQRCFEQLASE